MSDFYDKQKRKEKEFNDRYFRKVRSSPGGKLLFRVFAQKAIINRSETLRIAGNIEEAKKTVWKFLEEYLQLWREDNDPRDLHFIAETLRAGRMPDECEALLLKVLSEWPENYRIDPTWLYIDLGLASHQKERPYEDIIKWFEKALTAVPPKGASIAADNSIRARAAFCGFLASSLHNREKVASRFLSFLPKLDPKRDWNSIEALQEYRKTFIGFFTESEKTKSDVKGQSAETAPPQSLNTDLQDDIEKKLKGPKPISSSFLTKISNLCFVVAPITSLSLGFKDYPAIPSILGCSALFLVAGTFNKIIVLVKARKKFRNPVRTFLKVVIQDSIFATIFSTVTYWVGRGVALLIIG